MKKHILQEKEIKLTNPIKKISFLDKTDSDNKINNYANGRIPMALLGNLAIREVEFELESNDIYIGTTDVKSGEKTTMYEIEITYAPNEDVLNLYRKGKSFNGTIVKEVTLFTNTSSYDIETGISATTINTGMENTYYGHIYEFKKKNEQTNKVGNLGYEFVFYVNPRIYTYGEISCIIKELFGID